MTEFDTARAAADLGLILVTGETLIWTRDDGAEKGGDGNDAAGYAFVYRDERGTPLPEAERNRLDALAVPPAYREVRFSPDPNAHLQAVGTDADGRVQYRYHPLWDAVREREKALRVARLVAALPRIRRQVAKDLKARGTPKRKALAAAVRLIDRAHIRVGNDGYLKRNRTRGATTLLKSQITAKGKSLALRFTGKSGKKIARTVRAAGLSRAVKALAELPGRRLFQYRDADGSVRRLNAADVNAYLAEAGGAPVTAKDFRTLAASARAAKRLAEETPKPSEAGRSRQVSAVMKDVAARLANTPAVARKSYVHDRIVEAFASGELQRTYAASRKSDTVTRAERTVAKLLADDA